MATHIETLHASINNPPEDGPVSRKRQLRTRLLYLSLVVVGLASWFTANSPGLQAFGLGLMFPGAGFFAVGGFALLLVPLTLLLMAVALFAWFGSGMIIAPPIIWLGSALLSAGMAQEVPGPAALYATLAVVAGFNIWNIRRRRKRRHAELAKREQRNSYLPTALAEVRARAEAQSSPASHELSADDVAHFRLLFERALQPVGQLDGFERIDQFQTSAQRYQINFIGYALGQLQSLYLPNFHGYLNDAQQRMIEQYLQRPIWDYWRLENLWGNFKYDPNPVGKDNIMLTGYFGMQVALYMLNTGDKRYAERGSLTFRWNDRTAYEHDIHTITESVLWNFNANPFCLFPCEPNWIYTGCNFRGIMNVAVYDSVFGTRHLAKIKPSFLEHFDREFSTPSGGVVSLRSSVTGATAPFPGGEAGAVVTMNILAPERAERYWAIARHDLSPLLIEEGGLSKVRMPGKGLDFGNYGRGFTMIFGGLLQPAREMGDRQFSEALLNSLEHDCGRALENGVLRYQGSNLANSTVCGSRINQRNGMRQTLLAGPTREALRGPILTGISYPDVLVAKARSNDGSDLDLVLYPGKAAGSQSISIERLQADRAYSVVVGNATQQIKANQQGRATFTVHLDGRTPVRIERR
ncbi:MAG: hypothetical protein ABW034_19695 [Steroidobacteraceae bacterium]